MSVFTDITSLRKEGKLDEAYEMAKNAYAEDSDNLWIKRAFAWVLYDFISKNASVKNRETLISYLKELKELDLPAEEDMVFNSVLWAMRKFYADCENLCFEDGAFYDLIWDAYRDFSFDKENDAYFALLKAVLANKRNWERFPAFVEWWGLDNLRDCDFEPFVLQNGKRLLSLAERCYMELCKYYEANGTAEETDLFIEKLRAIVQTHSNLTYMPYYLAKLLIKQGRQEEAVVVLKPFVRSKPKEFWVWQLMAEAHPEDKDKLIFLCKALACGGKDEMLVGVRESAAELFAKLNFHKEAKFEIDKVIEVREKNRWRISASLLNVKSSQWYKESEAKKTNKDFYEQYSELAEEVVFGEKKTFKVLVSFVNGKNGFVSFVTEDRQTGFFKNTEKVKVKTGDVLELAATALETDKPSCVKSFRVVEDRDNANFFKKFEGKVRKNAKAGFCIVSGVFVSSDLLKDFADNDLIKGIAMISFDKKRNQWGWSAIKV